MHHSSKSGYAFRGVDAEPTREYLWSPIFAELDGLGLPVECRRVFDLGCGNGALAQLLADNGWNVAGVDPSESGIAIAHTARPHLNLRRGSSDDDLPATFGTFPVVISLEVIEHVYSPRRFAQCVHDLLEPGGTALISTPYHGYWKNLVLAIAGKTDAHYTALWDEGHIKFWSIKTLSALLIEAGLRVIRFIRVGRVPIMAKSMIAVVQRPR